MGNINILYGVPVRDAILTNDIDEMKAMVQKAKEAIKKQLDLQAALFELEEAIAKIEASEGNESSK